MSKTCHQPLGQELPVLQAGDVPKVRPSARSKWRATVLAGVHVLIIAHITHFLIAGRTISPLEPSESMYTLELGQVNAGFVFFVVAVLSTLCFGRFFCGWGCHIVALQDLCGWLMKRAGVRPRPFRSRLLAFVPLVLAFYMFAWPAIERAVFEQNPPPFPPLSNHLMTTGFWDTFPTFPVAVLTFLVCGFMAVYFLGAKGFCTYGCPYGAVFGLADRLSPSRIRVTDACQQCGHCTATCTSNVRVHEEVRQFGMVVDSGCMKCTDCISVCPTEALYLGLGRPAVFAPAAESPVQRRYDASLPVEIVLALICLGVTVIFRGLYDGPPLLMSVAIGVITAWIVLKLWQLVRLPAVQLQTLPLKTADRLCRGGKVFAALSVIWLSFTVHSGFVQWHRWQGRKHLQQTEITWDDVRSGKEQILSPGHTSAVAAARAHFETADRWGCIDVIEIKMGLAWTDILAGRLDAAERNIRRAIELRPQSAQQHQQLFEFLMWQNRIDEAADSLSDKLKIARTTSAAEHFQLAGLYARSGRPQQAIVHYRVVTQRSPDAMQAHFNLGGLLRRTGQSRLAVDSLRRALELAPADADIPFELAHAYADSGNTSQARHFLQRGLKLDGQRVQRDPEAARLHRQLGLASSDD